MLVSKTSIKGERDWCFAVDMNNHISALLQKSVHKNKNLNSVFNNTASSKITNSILNKRLEKILVIKRDIWLFFDHLLL